MSNISVRLRQIRLKEGLTQAEMAQAGEVADRTYKYYELGKRPPPVDFIQRLAKKFGLETSWLIDGEKTTADSFDRYVELFTAFDAAREAYVKFEKRNVGWSDVNEMERSALWTAGKRLAAVGGTQCMGAAIRAMFPDEAGRTLRAGDELNHLWSGIDGWMA